MVDDLLSLDDVADAVTSGNLDAQQAHAPASPVSQPIRAQTALTPTPAITPTPTSSPDKDNGTTGVVEGQIRAVKAVKAVESQSTPESDSNGNGSKKKDFDPSKPLERPKFEKFARWFAETGNGVDSYRRVYGREMNERNAGSRASILRKRPEIASRIEFLLKRPVTGEEIEGAAPERITRDGLLDRLEKILNHGTPEACLKAIGEYRELMGIDGPPKQDERRSDPCKVTPVANDSRAALRDQCRVQGMAYAIVIDTDGELREAMAPTLKEVLDQVTPAQSGAS